MSGLQQVPQTESHRNRLSGLQGELDQRTERDKQIYRRGKQLCVDVGYGQVGYHRNLSWYYVPWTPA